MVRIINHCYSNLNYRSLIDEIFGDDITNEIAINTSPTTLLSTVNLDRRIIKIYISELSNSLASVWIRHGTNITHSNASFAIPLKHLYVNESQASRPLSVICSEGTGLLNLTVVNKL